MSTVTFNQNGYIGSSMSVHASEAYADGEMPKSKWTKALMLEAIGGAIAENDIELTDDQAANIRKMNREQLFGAFFYESSWHHTGKFANETSFYSVDEDKLTEIEKDGMLCVFIHKVIVRLGFRKVEHTFASKREASAYMSANGFDPEKKQQVRGGFSASYYSYMI